LEDPGIDGRIILKRKWDGVAQESDRLQALVNQAMNLRFPLNVRNFWAS